MSHISELYCQPQLTTNQEINQWYPVASCTFSVLDTKQVGLGRGVSLEPICFPWMTSLQEASPSTPSFLDAGGNRPGPLQRDELPSDKVPVNCQKDKLTEGEQEREGRRVTRGGCWNARRQVMR